MSKFVPNSPYVREELREELGINQGLTREEIEESNPVGVRATNSSAQRRVLRGVGGRTASTPGTRAYRQAMAALALTEPFTPASLFAASEPGFWAEVSPRTTWTDTARTTPATVGASVASWQLNTAAGVIYATQINVPSRPLLQQTAGGRYYLDFEVDDWMVTPTITPGTDKAQVFAGVRKDSDAVQAVVVEHGNAAFLTGSFVISAPNLIVPGANYRFDARGDAGAGGSGWSVSTFTAPTTNVLSCQYDLAGAGRATEVIARVDGLSGAQSAVGLGSAGGGNFLARPLNIGARGGTSLFFNGRIYSLIVRFGANLTAGQIDNAEAWTAGRTGITL